MRRVRAAAVLVRREVRQRDGLAELHGAARERRGNERRPQPLHGQDRSALQALRRTSRSRLRGRTCADGAAVLHERNRDEVRTQIAGLMPLFATRKLIVPAEGEALPGRDAAMPVPERHAVLGTPLRGPFPAGFEQAVFGLGCFWGAERKFWQQPGVY